MSTPARNPILRDEATSCRSIDGGAHDRITVLASYAHGGTYHQETQGPLAVAGHDERLRQRRPPVSLGGVRRARAASAVGFSTEGCDRCTQANAAKHPDNGARFGLCAEKYGSRLSSVVLPDGGHYDSHRHTAIRSRKIDGFALPGTHSSTKLKPASRAIRFISNTAGPTPNGEGSRRSNGQNRSPRSAACPFRTRCALDHLRGRRRGSKAGRTYSPYE